MLISLGVYFFKHHFMFLSIMWMLLVGYFVNSFVLSRIAGLPFVVARSRSFKSSLISALFSVVFTWYCLSWILAFAVALFHFSLSDSGGRLLIFSGVAIVFYCCSSYFLSQVVKEDEDLQGIELWLLLAHVVSAIIGFLIIDFLGSFLLRSLMRFI